MTTGAVGADVEGLSALADALALDHDAVVELRDRVRWTATTLATLPGHGTGVGRTVAAVQRLDAAAVHVDELRRGVLATAAGLHAADRAWPGRSLERWWRTGAAGIRWLDGTLPSGIHELPGVPDLPAPELRGAVLHAWGAARAVDAATGRPLGRALAGVTAPARARVQRVAAAAARLVGGTGVVTTGARVADVLASPAVRRAARTAGRAVAVVGVATDVVEGVERWRAGDTWGAARSGVTAAAGVAVLVASNPVVLAVATVVVAGIHVYEHREAIGRSLRTGWDHGARLARRTGRALDRAAGAVEDAGASLLAGARGMLAGALGGSPGDLVAAPGAVAAW